MFATTIRRGDVGVRISDTLVSDGDPINLAGKTVYFNARLSLDGVTLRRTATVDEPSADGNVHYDAIAGDFFIPGVYLTEWEIEDAVGGIVTSPQSGYNILVVETDLTPTTTTLPPTEPPTTTSPILHGTGSPEGVVAAEVGTIYLDVGPDPDGGRWYMKRTGSGTTGWSG
jgi:hypothetical protein